MDAEALDPLAVVVFAGTERHEDLGRMLNSLQVVREHQVAGEAVKLIFDGAGVQWIPQLSRKEHQLHAEFVAIKDALAGACAFCADAFGAREPIERLGIPLLDENDGHPSLRELREQGFDVVTF